MELETFKIRVLPLREKLLNISLRLTEEKADAEDIVQEAFLKLWHIRNTLDDYQSVEALAVTVTRNLALDALRTRKPGGKEPDTLLADPESRNPEELLEQQDAIDCIRRLISRLPSLQQTIIRMKDIDGYEVEEIAEITGSRIEAVRVNLSRARKKIKEQWIAINQQALWI
ncbi:MAG: sigma-70 family RNA polymerase sigma factor [Tannerellaceae bacterium]|nr:sigma-70 family RNA polymerase sigma factor [Tannerellaceae bacterium]